MDTKDHFADVVLVLETYFDGLYEADAKKLSSVFHDDARYVNTVEGDYMNYSIEEYFNVVNQRTPPAVSAAARLDQILSIEFASATMAFAKVSMTMLDRDYIDFLTLIYGDNQWKIISKVFFYTSISQEK